MSNSVNKSGRWMYGKLWSPLWDIIIRDVEFNIKHKILNDIDIYIEYTVGINIRNKIRRNIFDQISSRYE